MTLQALIPRGLFFKLCLFFLILALPALVVVETTVVWLEFRQFAAAVDAGAMQRAVAAEAPKLRAHLERDLGDRLRLDDALAGWLMRLERPRDGIGAQDNHILLELTREPLSAVILAADGSTLAAAPGGHHIGKMLSALIPDLPADGGVQQIQIADSGDFARAYATRLGDDPTAPVLHVQLRIPLPWQRVLLSLSFEWPIMLGFLLLFAGSSALFMGWYVTRRLHAIEDAARAWRRGDFSPVVDDRSRDELGRLAQQLNLMAADLHELVTARGELAAMSERARLARDLHDTVKQKAFALSLQLAAVQARLNGGMEVPGPLAEARRLADDIQCELAQVLDELRHPQRNTLTAQLSARAEAFERQTGIAVELTMDAAEQVPADQCDNLLRAVDEALANVMRHSGASHAQIALQRNGSRLGLQVSDDGRGFSGEPSGGSGIGNLRARAQALPGGSFEWRSKPGLGAVICINWIVADDNRR